MEALGFRKFRALGAEGFSMKHPDQQTHDEFGMLHLEEGLCSTGHQGWHNGAEDRNSTRFIRYPDSATFANPTS